MIVQYIKMRKKIVGVLVCIKEDDKAPCIGWSLCRKEDSENISGNEMKCLGTEMAINRAKKVYIKDYIPRTVQKAIFRTKDKAGRTFHERCMKYFKTENISITRVKNS